MKYILCFMLGTVINTLSTSAHADFAQGVQAFQQQDYARAVLEFSIDAHAGHAESQVNLGLLYENGLGVERDPTQAFHWYQQAATQDNVAAQNNLAALYFEGTGTEQSYEQAAHWYQQAAIAGDSNAQYNLAVMYQEGLGVEFDLVQAWAWLELAAAHGAFVGERERSALTQQLTAGEMEQARALLAHYELRYGSGAKIDPS